MEEFLEFLASFIYDSHFPELVENLMSLGGVALFLPLLQNESELVRVQVLRVIGKLMNFCSAQGIGNDFLKQ